MRIHRLLAGVMAAALLFLQTTSAFAQDSGPRPDPRVPGAEEEPAFVERVDLAAIALASDDLPSDFTLTFEAYLTGSEVSKQLFGGEIPENEIEEIGLRWYYESQYDSADGLNRIRTYIEEYESDDAVQDGFDLLEDEDRNETPGMSYVDKPGLEGIGEEPSEVTVVIFESTEETDSGATIDASFRVGNLLVGIALDTISTTAPDEELLVELATRIEERALAVLEEDDLPGIEPHLATSMLGFGDALVIQEGYVTLIESVGAEAPEIAVESFESGYIRTVVLGMDVNPDLPLPFVTLSASSFSSESGALAYLSDAETLTPALAELERAEIDRIPGASAVVALSYANPFDNGSPDSFKIVLVIDTTVLTVDVIGAGSLDEARKTALALVEQQVPCVAEGRPCGVAVLPAGFEAAEG